MLGWLVLLFRKRASPVPRPSTIPQESWNRPAWQLVRLFAARLFNKRRVARVNALVRIQTKDANVFRSYYKPKNKPYRIWRYNNMSLAKETLYKYTTEEKTFGADFSSEGAIKSGETIVSGTIDVSPMTGTPPTFGLVEVITERFLDSDGKTILPYKGLKCRVSGGDASTRIVMFHGTTSGGDLLTIPGKLVIENPTT